MSISVAESTTPPPPRPEDNSFFSTILTPGSSLHPTLLLVLDGAFFALFLVLAGLALATRGNFHVLALIAIEAGLWGSVKWFVYELQQANLQEKDADKNESPSLTGGAKVKAE